MYDGHKTFVWWFVAGYCNGHCTYVGIDLVPIKPIHNVTTYQEDITSEKCRQVSDGGMFCLLVMFTGETVIAITNMSELWL